MNISWDAVSSTTIASLVVQKVRRRMVGADRNQRIDVPGRDGGWVFSERRGFREITAECVVVQSPSTRHADVVSVADWLDKSGERKLIFSDQSDRYWLATLAEDPDPDEWRQTGRFDVTWTAQPYAYAIATTSVSATASAGVAQTGTFAPSDTIDAYPVVEITPLNGTLSGFTLTLNSDALVWAGTAISAGSTITVSSVSFTVTTGINLDTDLTGAFDPSLVSMRDVSGDFGMIISGTNTWGLSWAGTATAVRLTFTWRRRYR